MTTNEGHQNSHSDTLNGDSGLDPNAVDFDSFLSGHFSGLSGLQGNTDNPANFVGSLPANQSGFNTEYGAKPHSNLSSSYTVGPSMRAQSVNAMQSGVKASLSRAMASKGSRSGSTVERSAMHGNARSPASVSSSVRGKGRPKRRSLAGASTSASVQPVDRKRRDNINEKIQELMRLIPSDFFNDSKEKSGTKDGKPNKGQILSKSVDYITWLQQRIDENNRKEVELSIKLRNLEIANNVPINRRMNLLHTSAEVGLSKIGVGPLAEQQLERQQKAMATSGKSPNSPASPGIRR